MLLIEGFTGSTAYDATGLRSHLERSVALCCRHLLHSVGEGGVGLKSCKPPRSVGELEGQLWRGITGRGERERGEGEGEGRGERDKGFLV